MKTYLVTSLKITALTMILFGVIYPLVITGIATFTAPGGGDGKPVVVNGKVVGFEVIGQSFTSGKYFNGRPSAVGYNAASTGGSNKGPTNPEYLAQVEERLNVFLSQNAGTEKKDIPVDLITASGGGLDPDISPKAAFIQVSRIASARGLKKEKLDSLVTHHIHRPLFGLLGTETVNVLELNVAMDKLR